MLSLAGIMSGKEEGGADSGCSYSLSLPVAVQMQLLLDPFGGV